MVGKLLDELFFDKNTLIKANKLVKLIQDYCLKKNGVSIPNPEFNVTLRDDIQVYWKTSHYELMLNVPKDDKPISYQGYNHTNSKKICGKF